MNDAPLHLDARLDWIIARCDGVGQRAERRVNGVENSLAGLARKWRSGWSLETLDSTVPGGWIRILLAPSDTAGT